MGKLVAFIKNRRNEEFKILPVSENVFSDIQPHNEITYSSEYILEEGEWFKIEHFSQSSYFPNYFDNLETTTSLFSVTVADFSKMKFLVYITEECFYFQKVFKSNFIRTKGFRFWEDSYTYLSEADMFVVKELPDAIYYRGQDKLIFIRLEFLEIMFKGISQLYREATNQEVQEFLSNENILLNNFNYESVSKQNRHRISLVRDRLLDFSNDQKIALFEYTKNYCSELVQNNNFVISSDNDLKLLLYGILERFYTSPVSHERRIANSISRIDN